MTKVLQAVNIVMLLITIVINYLSNTGIFNGNTMATVSARYQNLFTPAGYAFSIWRLIYILLIAFVIYQSRGLLGTKAAPPVVLKIGWMFTLSCFANSLWVLAWLYDFTGLSVLIMIILFLSLATIIVRTRMELDVIPFKRVALEWWPFAIYFGWINVALIANIAAYLTKIRWTGLSPMTWAVVMICLAALINLFLIYARNLRESAAVGAWALIAIAVANRDSTQTVAYVAIVAAAMLLINCGYHGFLNRKRAFR